MKIKVFGKDIKKLVGELSRDFEISDNPDVIISYGGDGTFLMSERKFPGIPKLLVRNKNKCYKCSEYGLHSRDKIKDVLKKRRYKIINIIKLEARKSKIKLLAVNDIIIRNKSPTSAIRFSIKIGNRDYKEIIGDGIVVATPFGSGGYFNSITRKKFNKGIGIAFNNSLYKIKPWIVDENSEITIKILREEAQLSADNDKKIINLNENDIVKIKKHREKARVIKVR